MKKLLSLSGRIAVILCVTCLALALAACGHDERPTEDQAPQMIYDGANETIVVVQDRDDDDLWLLWYYAMLSQHSYGAGYADGYNRAAYTSYRTTYVQQRPAYVQPVRITYSNTTNIISNPAVRPAVAPKPNQPAAPVKGNPGSGGGSAPQNPAPAAPKAPAPAPRTK